MSSVGNPGIVRHLARWLWRKLWSRGMAWTLIALASLIVLYYQFENWRSARELVEARQRLVDRVGSDDLLSRAPADIRDDQNFFAIPVIESWKTAPRIKGGFPGYEMPDDLVPKDLIWPEITGEVGDSRLDLKGWLAKRAAAGQPLTAGESPAEVLNRELGDAHGVLPRLMEGMNRPFSCMKPGKREAIDAARGDPWTIEIPNYRGMNRFLKQLDLYIRVAAHAGDAQKTRDLSFIALRFCEGASTHGGLICCLVGIATHGVVLPAIGDALACPVWDEASLTRLQKQLANIDDLVTIENAFGDEVVWGYQQGVWMRNERGHLRELELFFTSADSEHQSWWERGKKKARTLLVTQGPIGWHDANIAFYVNSLLDVIGPKSEVAWLDAYPRYKRVYAQTEREDMEWNPRRFIGAPAIPKVGSIFEAAAQCLFQRRSLIIGCALERHRLSHGVYPPSLAEVSQELSAFHVNDPARPDQPLGYRLESNGYLLWSAGPDAKDDGGDPEKDWLWRMKRD